MGRPTPASEVRAFRKSKVLNEILVVRDGVEALDYRFSTGTFAGRDPNASPELVLFDLKLPKVNGLAGAQSHDQPMRSGTERACGRRAAAQPLDATRSLNAIAAAGFRTLCPLMT